MKTSFLLCFAVIALSANCSQVAAQLYCPNNINLENGSLNFWKFDTGSNNGAAGISALSNTSPITGRHTLTSGTGTDYYGGFPVVDPAGGSYSLKLGNDQTGAEVDRARYIFTVPANVNDYSLIYRYAVVFENPTNPVHSSSEQPFFRVRVYDSATGVAINCASFTYVSQGGLPGFSTSIRSGNHNNGTVVYYKPWSTASLNLSGQAGKTLVLEFTTADCALGAHMGYGYVDVSCGLFAITGTTCNATSPLTAPAGFQSYTWYNANYSTVLGSGQTMTITTPTVLTQYHMVLTPYPGYGCQDTLHTELIGSTLALARMPDTMLCNNASITLNPVVTGNVPPFTYSWSPATGLSCTTCASPVAAPATTTSYMLTVTDSLGCVKRDTVEVKAKVALTATGTNAPCYGLPGGSATAIASSGTSPYTYSWSTVPVQSGATAASLLAGSYTVTVTDAKGCIATQAISITSPTQLVVSIASKDSVSCNGGADGKAIAAANGGVSPYTYSWNTAPIQTGTTATGLSTGTKMVTVTDANGCTDTESVNILQPLPLAIALSVAPVLCKGDSTGTATISGSGGTPPYTYSVDARSFGSSNTLNGLAAGMHILHLKDMHGCLLDSTITIVQPTALVLAPVASSVLCFGAATGGITATAVGGISPYTFAIDASAFVSTNTFSGLATGPHTVHLKDANGCLKDSIINITQPAVISLGYTTTQPLCNGASNGAIAITGAGGTTPYQYALGSGPFGASGSFTGLSAGIYTLHLKDANNCTKDSIITLTQPTALASSITKTNVSCNGGANGTAQVTASGGTMPYSYSWTGTTQTSAAVTSLAAGSYTVTVTDAKGCTFSQTVSITQPTALTATAVAAAPICNNTATGSGSVSVSGGTAPYAYN